MGGDDSQKLLPRRGAYSPPGRSKPPAFKHQHFSSWAICLAAHFGFRVDLVPFSGQSDDGSRLKLADDRSQASSGLRLRFALARFVSRG